MKLDCDELLINNAMGVRIVGLTNAKTGEPINDADCAMTLKDASGANVSGAVDLPLEYQADSAGNYFGELPALNLTLNARYTLVVVAMREDEVIATWEPERIAKKRGNA